MLWYIFIFASVLFYSLLNITDKLVSSWENKKFSLILRYLSSLWWSILMLILFWWEIKLPSISYIAILIFAWLIYYFVNISMYKWLKHLKTWMFFMIAYSYLILVFFMNILVFWKTETLSPLKTLLALIFISYVIFLTYKSWKNKWKNDFIWYILAILCSLWWSIWLFLEWYYIKYSIASPYIILVILYSWALITAIINYFIWNHEDLSNLKLKPKKLIISWTWWVLIFLWTISLLYTYKYIKLNIVNTISTSEIFFTTILAMLFLKEKPSYREFFEIVIWFLIMVIFVAIK